MKRVFAPLAILLALIVLPGCKKAEEPAKVEARWLPPPATTTRHGRSTWAAW